MSKANQAFKQNDEAVSPVIGVILMVAITVVLAAVVFVLVSNLGESSDDAPTISFTKDEADNDLTVIRVSGGPLNIDDVEVTDAGTAACAWEDAAGTAIAAGTDLGAGDVLDCDDDAGEVTIVYTPTDTLLYQTTFT